MKRMCLHASVLLSLATVSVSVGICQSSLEGIETADLDRKAGPCTDFYEYSNGTWRAQNPIPNSMDRWSRRWKAGEDNKDQLKVILDDLSSHEATKGTPAQLTGDFYAACTNVKTIDAAGIKPIAPLLEKIAAIKNANDLQAAIRELHAINVQVPFNLLSQPDVHDPQNVIADVGAGGARSAGPRLLPKTGEALRRSPRRLSRPRSEDL